MKLLQYPIIYAAAVIFGYIASRASLPLPWMIGPLVSTALLYSVGAATPNIPKWTRSVGQSAVAAQVGLFFTRSALETVVASTAIMVGMALLTLFSSIAVALIMSHRSGSSLARWFVATIPVGPVEAANIARSCGLPSEPVIFMQIIRVTGVVIFVPMLMYWLEGRPARPRGAALISEFEIFSVITISLVAAAGGLIFKFCSLANPFFLGPMAATAALTSAGIGLVPFPPIVLSVAQIVLGVWLGSSFRRDTLIALRRLIVPAFVSAGLLLTLNGAGAFLLAWLLDANWRDYLLAAAPGGVTEIALTAKFLGADVALIIGFHLCRIFLIVPNTPWLVRMMHKRRREAHD